MFFNYLNSLTTMVPFMFLQSKSYFYKKQCLHSNIGFLKFIPNILSRIDFGILEKSKIFRTKNVKHRTSLCLIF